MVKNDNGYCALHPLLSFIGFHALSFEINFVILLLNRGYAKYIDPTSIGTTDLLTFFKQLFTDEQV